MTSRTERSKAIRRHLWRGGAFSRGGSRGWNVPQEWLAEKMPAPGSMAQPNRNSHNESSQSSLMDKIFVSSCQSIVVGPIAAKYDKPWLQPHSYRRFLVVVENIWQEWFRQSVHDWPAIVVFRIDNETARPPVHLTMGRQSFEPTPDEHEGLAKLIAACREGDKLFVGIGHEWDDNFCLHSPSCSINMTGWTEHQREAHRMIHAEETEAMRVFQQFEKQMETLQREPEHLRQENERLRRERDDAVTRAVTSDARYQQERHKNQQPYGGLGGQTQAENPEQESEDLRQEVGSLRQERDDAIVRAKNSEALYQGEKRASQQLHDGLGDFSDRLAASLRLLKREQDRLVELQRLFYHAPSTPTRHVQDALNTSIQLRTQMEILQKQIREFRNPSENGNKIWDLLGTEGKRYTELQKQYNDFEIHVQNSQAQWNNNVEHLIRRLAGNLDEEKDNVRDEENNAQQALGELAEQTAEIQRLQDQIRRGQPGQPGQPSQQGQQSGPVHPNDPNRRQPLTQYPHARWCNWCGEQVDRLVC